INFGAKRERYPAESLPRSLSVKTEAGKVVLYQLSYFRMINFGAKRERHPVESLPRSLSVKTEAGKVVLYQLSYFRVINLVQNGNAIPR
ncbi:MAG: hypothetical protein LLF74_09605, partial [Bacteroidales bacterium]|nr:hypothetical protein [Bacteroidales bacterium]